MSIECAYSFNDLHVAAFGKPLSREVANFDISNQDAVNQMVKNWADKAGWETKDKMGWDGKIYTAFAPSFNVPAEPDCGLPD